MNALRRLYYFGKMLDRLHDHGYTVMTYEAQGSPVMVKRFDTEEGVMSGLYLHIGIFATLGALLGLGVRAAWRARR